MADRLAQKEGALVSKLVSVGFSRMEAVAAVVLATRQYSRPKSDLIATLQNYAALAKRENCEEAVESLLAKGFLTLSPESGHEFIACHPQIDVLIENTLGEDGISQEISNIRKSNAHYVRVLGPLRASDTYASYVDLLRGVQDQVLMLHVMTDPDALESVALLRERAGAGVDVKVMGASANLASQLRGRSMRAEAKSRIASWQKIAKTTSNLNFRVTERASDLLFASSILVDTAILRMVVHDPLSERTKEGVVIECSSDDARKLNIVVDFERRFSEAWSRAHSPNLLGVVAWWVRSFWQLALGAVLTLLAVAILSIPPTSKDGLIPDSIQAVAGAIFGSFAASQMLAGLIAVTDRWKKTKFLIGKRERR